MYGIFGLIIVFLIVATINTWLNKKLHYFLNNLLRKQKRKEDTNIVHTDLPYARLVCTTHTPDGMVMQSIDLTFASYNPSEVIEGIRLLKKEFRDLNETKNKNN